MNIRTLALSVLSTPMLLCAAPQLQIGDAGVTLENGGTKCRMAFPIPVNAAKAKVKIQEKVVTGSQATLRYEGGGTIEISIAEGSLNLRLLDMPAGIQHILFSMQIDTTVVGHGKWEFDAKTGRFPLVDGGLKIHQGVAQRFLFAPTSGPGIAISFPKPAYQDLQDLRQFQTNAFLWQCWYPATSGSYALAITISDATGQVAAAASVDKPVTPAAPAKPVDRQTYGQLPPLPDDKKQTGTRILKWKDAKRAAYLLGFDDNGATHLTNVIPELEKRKMVGNFYVNPGSQPWKQHEAEWQKAAQSPYVVLLNHTFLHNGAQTAEGLEDDIVKTNEALYAITPHLKKPRIIGFRTPGGVPWKVGNPELQAILAKYKMVNRSWLDGPTLTMKSVEPVVATVDTVLSNGGTGFVDFHGVGGDGHSTPKEWFLALLDKLEAEREKLWITDTVSWHKYYTERKSSELKVVKTEDNQVRASLTSTSDPVFYDIPLTVAVEVPASWKECTITQGTLKTQASAAGGEVRFDALPGPDEIVITSK